VHLVNSLSKAPYIERIYMVLANPQTSAQPAKSNTLVVLEQLSQPRDEP